MSFDIILQTLKSDGSIVINKALAKNIGLNEAIIYSELLSRYCYFKDREQLTDGDWFFNTVEDLENGTTLNDYNQRKAIKALKELGLIETCTKGLPAKRYFKIVFDIELISKFLRTSSLNFKELEFENFDTNNTNINNTNNNTISKDIVTPKKSSTKKASNALIQPNDKKSKQTKKAKDIATMKGMIYAFTENEDIQDKLLEYFSIRIKKGLQPNQWKIILDDLREFTGGVTNVAIEKINNAIAAGYMQIIASWEKNKQTLNKQAKFDNTAGRNVEAVVSMSEQEKREFEQNLAVDGEGNLLQY